MADNNPEIKGRILAVDPGTKRIGVAVSDPGQRIARSIGMIKSRGRARDLQNLGELIREHDVVKIVVGLPLHLDGRESSGSEKAREFAACLEKEFGLQVLLVDESLSTVEAEDILIEADVSRKKRKKAVDGLAAAVILQSYLNELAEKGP